MNDDILLVDDDPSTIQLMARMLGNLGNLRFATNGQDALRLAHELTPDLVLLDAEMPGMGGFDVCRKLKADPALADVPVIFVTSHSEPEFEVTGLELGAADFIAKPVSERLVRARVKTQLRVKHLADELRRIAMIDGLTAVANRRHFDETFALEWRRSRRSGQALALLMIDVDHFKLFNDRYGHPAGDTCLRSVAQALVSIALRSTDLVARYGGEEFAVLLPYTERAGAEHIAQAVLDAVVQLHIAHETSLTARCVTVSVGVACYDADSQCWVSPSTTSRSRAGTGTSCTSDDLVNAADKALYSAKRSGRARAQLLDIADVDAPQLARDIAPAGPQATRHIKSVPAPAVTGEQLLLGKRVLVVADNDINLEVTQHILEREGAQVLLASNGLEAFERIQAEPRCIDVVLMDVQMTVLDGCDATRRVRRELNMPDLPIIALTSVALSNERQRATAAGMNDYLVRPLSPRTLVSSILRHASPAGPQLTGDPNTSNAIATPDRIWWPAIEGIDSTDVEARLSGDFTLFLSMLKRLLDEFSDVAIPATLEDCVLTNQLGRMHKLKGSAGMLGARAIQQLAGDVDAACAAGDIVRAAQIATQLVRHLQTLNENLTVVFAAVHAQPALRNVSSDRALDPQDLADLIQLMHRQSLSAIASFQSLAPQLRSTLGTDTYVEVRDHIDNLHFEQAARLLERNSL